ncbi:hypothetical protein Tco_1320775 [Tanacetum coccineum]
MAIAYGFGLKGCLMLGFLIDEHVLNYRYLEAPQSQAAKLCPNEEMPVYDPKFFPWLSRQVPLIREKPKEESLFVQSKGTVVYYRLRSRLVNVGRAMDLHNDGVV